MNLKFKDAKIVSVADPSKESRVKGALLICTDGNNISAIEGIIRPLPAWLSYEREDEFFLSVRKYNLRCRSMISKDRNLAFKVVGVINTENPPKEEMERGL